MYTDVLNPITYDIIINIIVGNLREISYRYDTRDGDYYTGPIPNTATSPVTSSRPVYR